MNDTLVLGCDCSPRCTKQNNLSSEFIQFSSTEALSPGLFAPEMLAVRETIVG